MVSVFRADGLLSPPPVFCSIGTAESSAGGKAAGT